MPRIVLPKTLFVLDVVSGESLDFQDGTDINSVTFVHLVEQPGVLFVSTPFLFQQLEPSAKCKEVASNLGWGVVVFWAFERPRFRRRIPAVQASPFGECFRFLFHGLDLFDPREQQLGDQCDFDWSLLPKIANKQNGNPSKRFRIIVHNLLEDFSQPSKNVNAHIRDLINNDQ